MTTYIIKVTDGGRPNTWVYENYVRSSFDGIDERLKPYVAMIDAAAESDPTRLVDIKDVGCRHIHYADYDVAKEVRRYYIDNKLVNPDDPNQSYLVSNGLLKNDNT